MDITTRKYKLMAYITKMNVAELTAMENLIAELQIDVNQEIKATDPLQKLIKPIRKKLDIEQLKKEQNYEQNRMDSETFFKLVDEINIEEPLEDLLNQLTK